MSIWCPWPPIGTDFDAEHPERGLVLSYAEGFGNHHPDLTGEHERPAVLTLAEIAPWCVPGHEATELDQDTPSPSGAWLRLDVAAWEVVDHWHRPPQIGASATSVVLDVAAARALRDDLTTWLEREHLHPTEKGAP